MTKAKKKPKQLTLPNGEVYKATLFKIESRDEFGRPENLVLLPNDRYCEFANGDEFLVAYVPERCLS